MLREEPGCFPCTSTRCYVHLFSVSASATDTWVLGAYSPKPGYQTLFTLRWNGSAWDGDRREPRVCDRRSQLHERLRGRRP